MDIFFEIHSGLPREAPGSREATLQAFSMLGGALPPAPRILDIGCGPGAQTLDLARVSGGHIIAVDTHQPFLDELMRRTAEAGLDSRIQPLNRSMLDLNLDDHSFDLIWSEGAIYIMGFEAGLRAWKRLLKPGGWLAATEVCWIKPDPPEEVLGFWESEYPAITSLEQNLEIVRRCGYRDAGHFVLPPSAWWEDYYQPMQDKISILRQKHHDDPEASRILDLNQREVEIFQNYHAWYSYAFFVCQAEV